MLDAQFTEVAGDVPNLKTVAFVPKPKPAPVTVTLVPPAVEPVFGLSAVMVGANVYVSFDVRRLAPPVGVFTVISTFASGSSGDTAVIELGELTVKPSRHSRAHPRPANPKLSAAVREEGSTAPAVKHADAQPPHPSVPLEHPPTQRHPPATPTGQRTPTHAQKQSVANAARPHSTRHPRPLPGQTRSAPRSRLPPVAQPTRTGGPPEHRPSASTRPTPPEHLTRGRTKRNQARGLDPANSILAMQPRYSGQVWPP